MFVTLIIVGVFVCGLLVLRHAVRNAPLEPSPATERQTEAEQLRAVDTWQSNIRLDASPDYTDAMEKLRKEERRQRPQEQRN